MALRNRKLADTMLQQEQIIRRFYINHRAYNGEAYVQQSVLFDAGFKPHGPCLVLAKRNSLQTMETWMVYGHYAIVDSSNELYVIKELPEEDIISLRRMYGDLF